MTFTTDKISICFYGNCQLQPLVKLFRYFYGEQVSTHLLPENYKLINGSKKLNTKDEGLIKKADLFVVQYMEEHNKGFLIDDFILLQGNTHCKVIRIPYVFLSSYWPDYKQVNKHRKPNDKYPSGLFPFGHLWIDKLVENDNGYTQVLNELLKTDNFNNDAILNNSRLSFQLLEEKEEKCDVGISDYIYENFRKKKLFHAACHPTYDVYIKLFERIHTKINVNYRLEKNDLNNPNLNTYDNHQIPIYPMVMAALKLTFTDGANLPWFDKKNYSIKNYIQDYMDNIKAPIVGKLKKKENRFVINVGGARCGTTAMHSYFDRHDSVKTPVNVKEIKLFLDNDLNINKYLDAFINGNETGTFFESSPPYMHSGIERFEQVLKNIKQTLNGKIVIVFNVRPLVERAFSHYWHDINKHYSIFGKLWNVKDKESLERYKTNYQHSFSYALKKSKDKLMPDFAGMINLAIKEFGCESVYVIAQTNLNYGIEKLSQSLDISFDERKIVRISSVRAPVFLQSGRHEMSIENKKVTVTVPQGNLLRLGYDQCELLNEAMYNLDNIIKAYSNWTGEVAYKEVRSIFSPYLAEQAVKMEGIPPEIFVTKENILMADYLTTTKDLKVKTQIPSLKDLHKLQLIL